MIIKKKAILILLLIVLSISLVGCTKDHGITGAYSWNSFKINYLTSKSNYHPSPFMRLPFFNKSFKGASDLSRSSDYASMRDQSNSVNSSLKNVNLKSKI